MAARKKTTAKKRFSFYGESLSNNTTSKMSERASAKKRPAGKVLPPQSATSTLSRSARSLTVIGCAFSAAMSISLTPAECAARVLRIATGPPDGIYHLVGEKVQQELASQGIALEVVPTRGSLENLDFLASLETEFALSQQDALSDFLELGQEATFLVSDRLFFESLHLLVRASLNVPDPSQIRGMKIWLGSPRSGSRQTAMRLLDSLGLTPSQVEMLDEELAIEDLSDLFRARELDVAMVVAVTGAPALHEGLRTGSYTLSPLSPETVRILSEEDARRKSSGQTFLGAIPRGTYPGQEEPVATLLVPTLLLTRSSVDPTVARKVSLAAKQAWDEIEDSLEQAEAVTWHSPPLSASGLPLASWYQDESNGTDWATLLQYLASAAVATVVVIAAYRGRKRLLRSSKSYPFATGTLITFLIALTATLGTFLYENKVNEHFSTVPKAIWSIFLYLLSGLENHVPYSVEGKAFAVLAIILGPVALAGLTGYVASAIVIRVLGSPMPKHLSGHYVILNWNERARKILEQIRNELNSDSEGNIPVVIVSDDSGVNKKPFEDASANGSVFEDVFFVVGDPTEERVLKNTNPVEAKAVVLLADDRLEGEADSKTIRSAFMLRKLLPKVEKPNPHVVVELVDSANMLVIDEVSSRFPVPLEVVAGSEFRTKLVSQAAMNPGFVKLYRDLLSVSADTNEAYLQKIPDSADGLEFPSYAALVLGHTADQPIVPIGVQRDYRGTKTLKCNPRPDEDEFRLRKGDSLVVIAYRQPEPGDFPEVNPGDSRSETQA